MVPEVRVARMTAPDAPQAALAEAVRAILAQLPMSDDGTGHVADCGYDPERMICGCYSLPGRLATVVARIVADRERALAERIAQRIEVEGAAAVARSTDWFNEGARRGAWTHAARIAREEGR